MVAGDTRTYSIVEALLTAPGLPPPRSPLPNPVPARSQPVGVLLAAPCSFPISASTGDHEKAVEPRRENGLSAGRAVVHQPVGAHGAP